jgi:hypothetical protein
MADYSGALKKFRDGGYPESKDEKPDDQEQGVRVIKLTDDEAKELQSYKEGDGMEQTCEVTGKLEGNTLRVMSVRRSGGMEPNMDADAAEAMGKPPMMQSQTLPSPS